MLILLLLVSSLQASSIDTTTHWGLNTDSTLWVEENTVSHTYQTGNTLSSINRLSTGDFVNPEILAQSIRNPDITFWIDTVVINSRFTRSLFLSLRTTSKHTGIHDSELVTQTFITKNSRFLPVRIFFLLCLFFFVSPGAFGLISRKARKLSSSYTMAPGIFLLTMLQKMQVLSWLVFIHYSI